MISFVWPHRVPFVSWAGGSEVYTLSQVSELTRRGIPARIITYTQSTKEDFEKYPDIPILALRSEAELSKLDDTLVFVSHPLHVPTRRPAYVILHNLITGPQHDDSALFEGGLGELKPLAPSKFVADYYVRQLGLATASAVVYPGADKEFAAVERSAREPICRVLFAGRPTQEKGPYVFLESVYRTPVINKPIAFFGLETINTNDNGEADAIMRLFKAHPKISVIAPGKNRQEMAAIYAAHDVIVMPSSKLLWQEPFGMVSVEAQHAGCRVVASNIGGLPETDCGNLILVEPDNPVALAKGIAQAAAMGAVSRSLRHKAASHLTIVASVDQLLKAINYKPV